MRSELAEDADEVVLNGDEKGLAVAADEEELHEAFEGKGEGENGESEAETERGHEKEETEIGEDRAEGKNLVRSEIENGDDEITESFEHKSTSFL